MAASRVLEPGWTAERSLVSVEAPQASGRLIRGPRGKGKGMRVRPPARRWIQERTESCQRNREPRRRRAVPGLSYSYYNVPSDSRSAHR
jgi:hypothetical protein